MRTRAAGILTTLGEAIAELVWSTRCIVCDAPGTVLCDSCRLRLPYIDRWLACPRCGSPHGATQCVSCNSYSLAEVGRSAVPFDRCVSAIEHRGIARSIITGYKDAGERRLAREIARLTFNVMPRTWMRQGACISYVPADRVARRRRGFDHMAPIAREIARLAALPCVPLLYKQSTSDQRGLTRRERFANMTGAVRMDADVGGRLPPRVILVDDVYTTGATLFAASDALRDAGVNELYCATFARVP